MPSTSESEELNALASLLDVKGLTGVRSSDKEEEYCRTVHLQPNPFTSLPQTMLSNPVHEEISLQIPGPPLN